MKCSHSEISQLCRGLALLLHSRIGLAEGVFLLAEEETGPFRDLLLALGPPLDAGETLSAALEQTAAFPVHVTGMIRIGEQTGRLEDTLNALARFYDSRQRTILQLRHAVAYPALIFLLMLVVLGVLLIRVLPVFDEVYHTLGTRLTGLAAGMLYLGQGLQAALPVLFLVLAAMAAALLVLRLSGSVRDRLNRLLRTHWGDRGVARAFNNAHFSQALALGLGSGLPLEDALDLARQLLSDIPGASARCGQCIQALQRGDALSGAMSAAGLLTPAQSRMLTLGLRGGNADLVMEELAAQAAADAEDALASAVSKVEPTMVLIVSILVGVILLSVMLPLMNILSTLG